MLEEANGSLLYIDEVNLLDDHIVNNHSRCDFDWGTGSAAGRAKRPKARFLYPGWNHEPRRGETATAVARSLEIERLKLRVHCLSQEIWDCTEYPNRINILIMLSAAVAELLLLESNQEARREGIRLIEHS